MDVLLKRLTEMRESIDESLTAQSPMQRHQEAEKNLQEQWEEEFKAAIEAEYRRQRAELLAVIQAWLRDIWLLARTGAGGTSAMDLLMFPAIKGTDAIAHRITPTQAQDNLQVIEQLQRWLFTNVQEALALEVGLLKLHSESYEASEDGTGSTTSRTDADLVQTQGAVLPSTSGLRNAIWRVSWACAYKVWQPADYGTVGRTTDEHL